jgi:hypothetical protein
MWRNVSWGRRMAARARNVICHVTRRMGPMIQHDLWSRCLASDPYGSTRHPRGSGGFAPQYALRHEPNTSARLLRFNVVAGKGNPKSAFEVVSEEICPLRWCLRKSALSLARSLSLARLFPYILMEKYRTSFATISDTEEINHHRHQRSTAETSSVRTSMALSRLKHPGVRPPPR